MFQTLCGAEDWNRRGVIILLSRTTRLKVKQVSAAEQEQGTALVTSMCVDEGVMLSKARGVCGT